MIDRLPMPNSVALRRLVVLAIVLATACRTTDGTGETDGTDGADVREPSRRPGGSALASGTSDPPFVDSIGGKTSADLGLTFVEPYPDEESPFVIGGRNETATIASLRSLAGVPIAELEARMRPGGRGPGGSDAGFLGPEESLLEVLCADNAYVVDELGWTHQELARSLLLLVAYGESNEGEFVYRGMRFDVEVVAFKGYQHSPFEDGTRTNRDATIRNLDEGESLTLSMLVPLMIERYGFYEGTGTSYRVDPRDVVAVLGLGPGR